MSFEPCDWVVWMTLDGNGVRREYVAIIDCEFVFEYPHNPEYWVFCPDEPNPARYRVPVENLRLFTPLDEALS